MKVSRVTSTKFLGIFIDEKLNWNEHILYLSKKVSVNVFLLRKVCPKINAKTSLMLYYALIYSHLSYCTLVWGGSSKKNLERLLKLQKKAVRIITYSKYLEHTNPLFKNLSLLKVIDIYRMQIASYMHKHVYCCPSRILSNSLSTPQGAPTVYATRNSGNRLFIQAYRTDLRGKSITLIGPRIWNSLPLCLRNIPSPAIFKRKLKSHLISPYNE